VNQQKTGIPVLFFRSLVTGCTAQLKITHGIAPRIFDVIFYVHPESKDQVKDYRRAESKERDINKIFANRRSGDAHSFTNGSTNSKHLPFYKVFYFIHFPKLI
jgi:hypothetical protein